MLTLFLLAFALLRAQAVPLATGPVTTPTVVHDAVYMVLHTVVLGHARSNTEGNMRSLYDIIRSCFFTIAACVYRAIHQNIPDPRFTMWGRLRVRVKITFYALVAPEAMIWWAMRQWFGARIVAKQVNQLDLGLKWSQTHGHFAQMGGFARKDNKHVLYPEQFIDLLQRGLLDLDELQITKEDIEDKSKGDALSKFLVAFQTTWFVFECLTRLIQGLPLIELEVVTFAFAILNVITYTLWWCKPLNVYRPILLRVRDEAPLVWPPTPSTLPHGNSATEKGRAKGTGMTKFISGVGKLVHAIRMDVRKRLWFTTIWKRSIKQPFLAIAMPLMELFTDEKVHSDNTHVSIFYGMYIPHEMENLVVRLSCFVGMIFGAIHFLSWNSSFPTRTQLHYWRISSVILVAQPGLMLLADFFDELHNFLENPDGFVRAALAEKLSNLCRRISLYIGPITYILARFCIITLAFIALRDLPDLALDDITWTSYIPHL